MCVCVHYTNVVSRDTFLKFEITLGKKSKNPLGIALNSSFTKMTNCFEDMGSRSMKFIEMSFQSLEMTDKGRSKPGVASLILVLLANVTFNHIL